METLPVELLGIILSYVDDLTLPCCSLCATAGPPPSFATVVKLALPPYLL
jgi:hypothetical protein